MKTLILLILLTPLTCFSTNKVDKGITGLLAWDNTELAADLSDYGQITLLASPFVYSAFSDNRSRNLKISGITIGVNYGVTTLTKFVTLRERPNGKNNYSFFSGHTSGSFTGAGLLCYFKSKACIPAIAMASIVGYLRLVSKHHWASDILVGAYIGYINGAFIPTIVMKF